MGRIVNPSKIKTPVILDDLITNIIKGEVVLVLGHEHMLREEFSNGDLQKQITTDFFKYKFGEDYDSRYQSFDEYYYKGADLSVLKQELAQSLSADLNNYEYSLDDYSPIVLELLRKKCFRVVLTTTYDHYLETILTDIWKAEGKKLRVLNIFDENNDFGDEEFWRTDIEPTLYYVFGKAVPGKDFTVVEKDAMNVIQKWLGESAPKQFCSYISNKSILALGTKFDDWLFRFFWYAMHRDIKRLNRGQVAISLGKESDTDASLSSFLENEKIPNSSIKDVVKLILDNIDEREKKFKKENGAGGDIFLSYSSESYETVKHLFYALKNEGFKVWFDNVELKAGDLHKTDIMNAIMKCKIFVPVITHPVKEILATEYVDQKSSFRYFRDVEWSTAGSRWALKDGSFMVMPFCMEGLTMKDIKIHESQESMVKFMSEPSAGDNRTQANFMTFVSSIKRALK